MRTDRAFEYDINMLIPSAEKEARAKVLFTRTKSVERTGRLATTYNHCMFTDYFHKAMKRLAIEAGLRRF